MAECSRPLERAAIDLSQSQLCHPEATCTLYSLLWAGVSGQNLAVPRITLSVFNSKPSCWANSEHEASSLFRIAASPCNLASEDTYPLLRLVYRCLKPNSGPDGILIAPKTPEDVKTYSGERSHLLLHVRSQIWPSQGSFHTSSSSFPVYRHLPLDDEPKGQPVSPSSPSSWTPANRPACPPLPGYSHCGGPCWHPAHPPRTVLGTGLRTGRALVVPGQTGRPERHSHGGLCPSHPPPGLAHDPGQCPLQDEQLQVLRAEQRGQGRQGSEATNPVNLGEIRTTKQKPAKKGPTFWTCVFPLHVALTLTGLYDVFHLQDMDCHKNEQIYLGRSAARMLLGSKDDETSSLVLCTLDKLS